MPDPVTREPRSWRDFPLAAAVGVGAAIALFVIMALAQKLGSVTVPDKSLDESIVAFTPPEMIDLEEDEPPPPEEQDDPPELDEEPPQLSLSQLDIALNPGTGGSLVGDFAMPTIGRSQSDLGTEDFVDFSDLDQIPRPIGVSGLNFPSRLRKKKVNGKIVLLIKIDERGEVLDVQLDSSNLPDFNRFVLDEVADWRFTPPTKGGTPVKAQARLPIPIRIH